MMSWHYGPMWTDDGAWMCYVCLTLGTNGARGLTDCEWIVPGTARNEMNQKSAFATMAR
jgi:hypothetical protein